MSFSNLSGARFAFSTGKQADIVTPNVTAPITLLSTDESFGDRVPASETDAAEIGKGHPFPTKVYPTSWSFGRSWSAYTSSEQAAFFLAYAMGKIVETAGTDPGAFQYAITPAGLPADCSGIGMLLFTQFESINEGLACESLNVANVGVAVESVTLNLNTGPNRDNSTLEVTLVGSGGQAPATITWPVAAPEHELNAGSAQITILSEDYIATAKFENLVWTWTNNNRSQDTGYYPGSGLQDGRQLIGRIERGDPTVTLEFQVRLDENSSEFANLNGRTVGSAVFSLDGATIGAGPDKNSLTIDHPQGELSTVQLGSQNGVVTLQCEYTPLVAADVLCTATVVTEITGIGQ